MKDRNNLNEVSMVDSVNPKVSVVIANRNDTVMLAVTVRSALEALKEIDDFGDIVIVDNSDEAIYKSLPSFIGARYLTEGKVKILRQPFPCLFTARELAIQSSLAEYVLCVDSHAIFGHNMVKDLVSFMDDRADDPTIAFAHAPISWAHQHEVRAKHDRDISINELGDWNKAYKETRKITWKGMPWICRREWFLDKETGLNGYGALAQHRISWGGGDMHIGVKPWLLGFSNWAVPTSPLIHIGPFPQDSLKGNRNIVKVSPADTTSYHYRRYSDSGNFPHGFGFLVSCYILGGESMMLRNKDIISKKFGKFIDVNKWWEKAMELGTDEKAWLDTRKVMSFEEFLSSKPWDNPKVNNLRS
jgi:hypothetical protein